MQCHKMKFASKADAKQYIRDSKRGGLSRNLQVYQCVICEPTESHPEVWHLTSLSKTEQRRITKKREARVAAQRRET